MRILAEYNSALGNSDSYVEVVLDRPEGGDNYRGVLRRWSVVKAFHAVARGEEGGSEASSRHEAAAAALTAEQSAALTDAVRKIQVRGIAADEQMDAFVDGWSTTLTIAHVYSSLAFRWSNDEPPCAWQGIDAVMETIERILRDFPERR